MPVNTPESGAFGHCLSSRGCDIRSISRVSAMQASLLIDCESRRIPCAGRDFLDTEQQFEISSFSIVLGFKFAIFTMILWGIQKQQ